MYSAFNDSHGIKVTRTSTNWSTCSLPSNALPATSINLLCKSFSCCTLNVCHRRLSASSGRTESSWKVSSLLWRSFSWTTLSSVWQEGKNHVQVEPSARHFQTQWIRKHITWQLVSNPSFSFLSTVSWQKCIGFVLFYYNVFVTTSYVSSHKLLHIEWYGWRLSR